MNKALQADIAKLKSYHADKEEDLRAQIDELSLQNSQHSSGGEWRDRFEKLRRDEEHLQRDHDVLQRHHDTLQQDYDTVQRNHDTLRRDHDGLQQDHGAVQQDHRSLQQEHQDLQRNLQEQQKLMDEVRRETSSLLTEMKAISDQSAGNWEREERLVQQVHTLEEEVRDWKARYAAVATQAGGPLLGSASLIPIRDVSPGNQDGSLHRANGLIPDICLTHFHIALDSTLRTARISDAKSVLDSMKNVVVAVRAVCHDLPDSASSSDTVGLQQVKARIRVSATTTNFITAAKNFAQAEGLSPISLLDAAASHVAAAIVDLVRLVGMRPATEVEAQARSTSAASSKISPHRGPSPAIRDGRSSAADSVYSNHTGPTSQTTAPVISSTYRKYSQTQRGQAVNGQSASSTSDGLNGGSRDVAPRNGYVPRSGEQDQEVDGLKVSTIRCTVSRGTDTAS